MDRAVQPRRLRRLCLARFCGWPRHGRLLNFDLVKKRGELLPFFR
jgi:hypothetical protein